MQANTELVSASGPRNAAAGGAHCRHVREDEYDLDGEVVWLCRVCGNLNTGTKTQCNMKVCAAVRGFPGPYRKPPPGIRVHDPKHIMRTDWSCPKCGTRNAKRGSVTCAKDGCGEWRPGALLLYEDDELSACDAAYGAPRIVAASPALRVDDARALDLSHVMSVDPHQRIVPILTSPLNSFALPHEAYLQKQGAVLPIERQSLSMSSQPDHSLGSSNTLHQTPASTLGVLSSSSSWASYGTPGRGLQHASNGFAAMPTAALPFVAPQQQFVNFQNGLYVLQPSPAAYPQPQVVPHEIPPPSQQQPLFVFLPQQQAQQHGPPPQLQTGYFVPQSQQQHHHQHHQHQQPFHLNTSNARF